MGLISGTEYLFTFLQFDVVDSSSIRGSNLLKSKLVVALKKFLISRISLADGLMINYALDGGIWGFYEFSGENESRHIRAVKAAIDILQSMSYFNSYYNPIEKSVITLRISLHAGNARYNDDTSIILGEELSSFMKFERALSKENTVTITNEVFSELDKYSSQFIHDKDETVNGRILSLYRYDQTKLFEHKVNSKSVKEDISIDVLSNKLSDILRTFKSNNIEYDTVYEERSKHYKEEKECIARQYINFLEKRVEIVLKTKKYNKVILLVDSGTTITPIFDSLAQKSFDVKTYFTNRDDVKIYTNNIRGILRLFKYKKDTSRYAHLSFDCNVLPGKILAPYEAFADELTIKAILEQKKPEVYIISISTGNYIIYNDIENKFLPIARTGFHPHVKSAMYSVANEVHVIAPLGKVLINNYNSKTKDLKDCMKNTLDKFNTSLAFVDDKIEEKAPYSLVLPDLLISASINQELDLNKWCNKAILVTTNRATNAAREFWLSDHYYSIYNRLNKTIPDSIFDNNCFTPSPYIYPIDFDGLPLSSNLQPKVEIPHKNLRNKNLLHLFFKVDKPDQ